jgi:hypothetical protein
MKQYYIEDNESMPSIVYCEGQPEGFSLITDAAKLLDLTMKDYEKKEKDGQDFYNGFRSKLLLAIRGGGVAPTDAFTVESYLSGVKNNLITGNWMTAQYINSILPLSGIYTQTLKDEIQAGIDAYVSQNY